MSKQAENYLVISLSSTGMEPEEVVEITSYFIPTIYLEVDPEEFHAFVHPSCKDWNMEAYVEKNGAKTYAINNARRFKEVVESFENWLSENRIRHDDCLVVAETGNYFGHVLRSQCKLLGIQLPWWGRQWVNLRLEYRDVYGVTDPIERIDLFRMLKDCGIRFEGKKKSSWDQAFNLALVVAHLLRKGCVFKHVEGAEDLKEFKA